MNKDREDLIFDNLYKVGRAILDEGVKSDNDLLVRIGSIVSFIPTLSDDDESLFTLTEICGMISAKKVLLNDEIFKTVTALSLEEITTLIEEIRKKHNK